MSRTSSRTAGAVAVLVAIAWLVAPAAAAPAQERSATAAEVAVLAGRAVEDDDALAQLRRIDEVDGRPADLAAATEDMEGERAARLQAIADVYRSAAGSGSAAARDPADARSQAQEVLDDDKFHEQELPRPFKGVLEWVADRVRPVGEPIGDLLGAVPGVGIVVLAALAAAAGWLAWLFGRRRSRAAVAASSPWRLVDPAVDPAELERRADEARRTGDLAAAVRLRYEAGIVRLARDGRIELRADTTARGAAEQLGDPALDDLTDTFERVVYGAADATPADADAAQQGWSELLGARSGRR